MEEQVEDLITPRVDITNKREMSGRPSAAEDAIVASEISTLLVHAGLRFAKRNYVATSMWILGLAVLALVSGFKVTPEAQEAYERELSHIDPTRTMNAIHAAHMAHAAYRNSGGLFSCDDFCMRRYNEWQDKEMLVRMYKEEDEAVLSKARRHVGVFSEYAVGDARELFWSIFNKGKDFAKRTSFYDLVFMGITSRSDETLVAFLIRFLFQMAVNFTIGLVGAFFAFVYYVGALVSSYQADPLSAISFYILAVLAAGSFVVSYIVALYAATAGTIYVVVKAAGPNFRIEYGGARGAPGRLQYREQREHAY